VCKQTRNEIRSAVRVRSSALSSRLKYAGYAERAKDSVDYRELLYITHTSPSYDYRLGSTQLDVGLLGLIDAPLLRRHRRHALVINTVLAAALTPGQDPFSMLLMAVPMVLMYELSVIIAAHVNPVPSKDSLGYAPGE
jgi:hypothetical protein